MFSRVQPINQPETRIAVPSLSPRQPPDPLSGVGRGGGPFPLPPPCKVMYDDDGHSTLDSTIPPPNAALPKKRLMEPASGPQRGSALTRVVGTAQV